MPVPEGITVLEASAGTGKTYAVASLVVDEVAEGRPLDEILVVTFTRKATGTLRERVWQRLKAAADALEPGAAATGRRLLEHLRRGTAAEVADRRANLARRCPTSTPPPSPPSTASARRCSAASAWPATPSATSCSSTTSAISSPTPSTTSSSAASTPARTCCSTGEAWRIAEAVVGKPDCRIAPVDGDEEDRLRRRFATTLRDRIVDQKRRGRLITYDDLLSRLDSSIADPDRGAIVEDRLRRRFSMAIVDEFQDTDASSGASCKAFGPRRAASCSWAIRSRPSTRSAAATSSPTSMPPRTRAPPQPDVSWRSDQALLDALNAFFAGARSAPRSVTTPSRPARRRGPRAAL